MTDWRIVGFLCETTLTDQDNRTSLIGIQPGRIKLNAFPTALGLGAFVRINPLPPVGTPIKIEVLLNEHSLAVIDAASVAAPQEAQNEFGLDSLHININRFIVMLEEPALLKMTVSVGDREPEVVSAQRIELAEPAP